MDGRVYFSDSDIGKVVTGGRKGMGKSFDISIGVELRDCIVDGKPGYFHCWAPYLDQRIYALVEFANGIEYIPPFKVKFNDEQHEYLSIIEEKLKERKNND